MARLARLMQYLKGAGEKMYWHLEFTLCLLVLLVTSITRADYHYGQPASYGGYSPYGGYYPPYGSNPYMNPYGNGAPPFGGGAGFGFPGFGGNQGLNIGKKRGPRSGKKGGAEDVVKEFVSQTEPGTKAVSDQVKDLQKQAIGTISAGASALGDKTGSETALGKLLQLEPIKLESTDVKPFLEGLSKANEELNEKSKKFRENLKRIAVELSLPSIRPGIGRNFASIPEKKDANGITSALTNNSPKNSSSSERTHNLPSRGIRSMGGAKPYNSPVGLSE